jgi:hypothetical protein
MPICLSLLYSKPSLLGNINKEWLWHIKKADLTGRLFAGGINLKYQLGAQNQSGMSIVTTTTSDGLLRVTFPSIILSTHRMIPDFTPRC